MKDKLDAARQQLSALPDELPTKALVDVVARRLARECTSDQIAQLLNDVLTVQHRLLEETQQCQTRITVLARAAHLATYRSPSRDASAS